MEAHLFWVAEGQIIRVAGPVCSPDPPRRARGAPELVADAGGNDEWIGSIRFGAGWMSQLP